MENRNRLNYSIGIFFLLFASFFPAYVFDYAFYDDYSSLNNILSGNTPSMKWDIESGRPTYAIFRYLAEVSSNGIESFSFLRLISALSVGILGVRIYHFLSRNDIFNSPEKRAFLAVSLCLTPCIQVYTAWATCFPFVISLILALESYSLISSNKITPLRFSSSLLLIFLSFAIYQPTAMAFLVFCFH